MLPNLHVRPGASVPKGAPLRKDRQGGPRKRRGRGSALVARRDRCRGRHGCAVRTGWHCALVGGTGNPAGCARQIIGSWRESRPRHGCARGRSPFTAPIVVANQRPHAFDEVAFGAERIQMGRMTAALPPHRGPAVAGSSIASVVELAVQAFFHVAFPSLLARNPPALQRHNITETCASGVAVSQDGASREAASIE